MVNYILLASTFLGLTSVGLGAYINHALVNTLDINTLALIKTALHYQEIYAVILSGIGLCSFKKSSILLKLSAWIFILGVILFSFSIYLKVFTGLSIWGKLTPIGGILLMLGWIILAGSSFKYIKRDEEKDDYS